MQRDSRGRCARRRSHRIVMSAASCAPAPLSSAVTDSASAVGLGAARRGALQFCGDCYNFNCNYCPPSTRGLRLRRAESSRVGVLLSSTQHARTTRRESAGRARERRRRRPQLEHFAAEHSHSHEAAAAHSRVGADRETDTRRVEDGSHRVTARRRPAIRQTGMWPDRR